MGAVALAEALVGVGVGAVIGALGYRLALLTAGGAAVTLVCVAGTFAAGGWEWGVVLTVHLLSAGIWSRYGRVSKRTVADGAVAGARSGAVESLARVGWPLLVALYRLAGGDGVVAFGAFVGAVATAAADTWNTEVGVLSPDLPRLITSRRPVPAGTPGAVSTLGLVAALGGAWLIGFAGLGVWVLSAWIAVQGWSRGLLWLPLAATFGGMVGSLVDSLLGSTAQVLYLCDRCERLTESPVHAACGERARRVRGIPWLTNEAVDLASMLVGSAVTALLLGVLAGIMA